MKVACLVSGGVDSSVALCLLKEQGHDVTAFYLKIWLEDELSFLGECPWEEDLEYVRKICEQVGVPLKVISMQKQYWDKVVSYTLEEVKAGRTPNPDIMCNFRVKFGAFYDVIDVSFEKVATGHYAQVESFKHSNIQTFKYSNNQAINHSSSQTFKHSNIQSDVTLVEGDDACKDPENMYVLKMAPDRIKDQTYFLSYLTQEQIARAMFPIGHLEKFEVRELAKKYNLPNKDRKDSQGICFLGKFKFRDFLEYHLGTKTGDFIEFESGQKLGEHNGFWYHTIGQRKGIHLNGGPWYVVKKDCEKNVVYISHNYDALSQARSSFEIAQCNWISGVAPQKSDLRVKIRHGAESYACKIHPLSENNDKHVFSVEIDGEDQGIAAGQFAVFYDNIICLGCGVIQ